MKIRALIAHGAAIGALAAGGLTLTTGTAQAAINCGAIRTQISATQNFLYWDFQYQETYLEIGDWEQAAYWGALVADDIEAIDNLQNQFRAAHCA
jgi:hypothetical protein